MSEQPYRIEMVESDPFAENSYIVWKTGSVDALIVDPGFDFKSIAEVLATNGLQAAAILNTHGHIDHIAGNEAAKRAFPNAPLIIGRNEAALLFDTDLNHSAKYGFPVISPPADILVDHGTRIEFAGFSIEVREIPGHSPGSVVFIFDEFDPPFVLGGDVLFAGSVGRTDLGGNGPQLFAGIRAHLYSLPDATVVWAGHGPPTTVGEEKLTNPFVRIKPER